MLILSSSSSSERSTWDSGVAGPGWTLSISHRTATCNYGSFTTILSGPRSYTSGSANKVYFEITVDDPNARTAGVAGGVLCGISNPSGPLTNYLGSDSNSSGYQCQDNFPAPNAWWWISNANTAVNSIRTPMLPGTFNYTVGIAVDFSAGFIWGTVNGTTWNNTGTDNPETGLGGLSLAALSPGSYYMALTGNNKTGSSASGRLVARAPFTFTVPSGFVAWG